MRPDLGYFNPFAETRQTENRLPHWEQHGACYFLTFHLADSVPEHLLDQWETERQIRLEHNPPPHSPEKEMEFHRRFSAALEHWLDAGHGSCLLRDPANAGIVAEALRHFDGERCMQIAWVVMPNHAHSLFVPHASWSLSELLHSWKSYTGSAINKRMAREGALWQKDYFDRIIRDGQHLENVVRYIRRNPEKAHLRADEYVLYESELARRIA